MLEEIGAYEAKTRLPELLRRVEAGESLTITKHGKPIADLVPSGAEARKHTQQAIDNLLNGKRHTITDEALNELRAEGRL